jgi:hypothetical protein
VRHLKVHVECHEINPDQFSMREKIRVDLSSSSWEGSFLEFHKTWLRLGSEWWLIVGGIEGGMKLDLR